MMSAWAKTAARSGRIFAPFSAKRRRESRLPRPRPSRSPLPCPPSRGWESPAAPVRRAALRGNFLLERRRSRGPLPCCFYCFVVAIAWLKPLRGLHGSRVEMLRARLKPDSFTYCSLLAATQSGCLVRSAKSRPIIAARDNEPKPGTSVQGPSFYIELLHMSTDCLEHHRSAEPA